MACALTQSITLDCRDSIGGVLEVYFIEADNVTSITEASGNVTAITKAGGKVFRKYNLEQETASFTETLNSSIENGTIFYQQELALVINKMSTNLRNELLLLNKNRLKAIVKDANGTYWYLGSTRNLFATGGTAGTGTGAGDRNGYSFTYTAKEPSLAPTVDSSIITALLS